LCVPLVVPLALGLDGVVRGPLLYTLLLASFYLSRFLAASLHGPTNEASYRRPAVVEYEPTVSFVIPCKNEQQGIELSVGHSLAADYPKEKVEVIVVDDGSTDWTPAVLAGLREGGPRLQVLTFERNRGKREAMAAGFRHARGEIIVQLDSDSYIAPDTVRNLIAPFADNRVGAVCAHARPANADANTVTRMQAAFYFLSFRILKAAESTFLAVLCCSGCCSAYRRSTVIPVLDDWLAEAFLGKPMTWGDDRALTNRLLRNGHRTIYSSRAHAYTICPHTLTRLLKQQLRWKKGWLVNTIFATPFVLRQYPFIALTYFLPLFVLTLATPLIAAHTLIWIPLTQHTLPTGYLTATLAITLLSALYYAILERDRRYLPFILIWSLFELLILSFLLIPALATLHNRTWGTR
jgi:hyaluronan synthase